MLRHFAAALADPLIRVAVFSITLMGAAMASVLPFQSVIGVERLGMSDGLYAAVLAGGAIFGVVAAITVGILTDQTGKFRGVLTLSILVGALAGFLMLVVPSVAIFILVHAVLFPIATTSFTQYFALAAVAAGRNPDLDKDAALSLVRAAFAGSFAVTPPLWALALASGVDLINVYAVLILSNVAVLGIVLTVWPKQQPAGAPDTEKLSFFQALSEVTTGAILLRLALVAVISASNGLYNILLGLLVVSRLGGTEADVGWFAGGVAAVEMPVMLATASLVKRYSRRGLILAGVAIYGVSLCLLGLVPSMALAWWLILPFGIGAGIILSVPVAYVQSLVAHRPGAGSSLLALTHLGGTSVASAVFAVGASVLSYSGVAIAGAVLATAAGLWLYRLK